LHPTTVVGSGGSVYDDMKGNLVLSSVGKTTWADVDVKASYNQTPYVAISIGYEYREWPRVYTKVDNKYAFGVI
jgi:hypothetical protein